MVLICLAFLAGPHVFAWERVLIPAAPGTPESPSLKNFPGKSFGPTHTLRGWTHARHWIPDLWIWRTVLQGSFRVAGLQLDLANEADMGPRQRPGFTFTRCLQGRGAVTLEGQEFDHRGTFKTPQTFRGRSYRVGSTVRLRAGWFDVAYRQIVGLWNFGESDEIRPGYVEAVGGLQVHRLDLDVSGLDRLGAFARGNWSEQQPLPYLGLAAGGEIRNRLLLRAYFKFLPIGIDYMRRAHDVGVDLALHLHRRPGNIDWLVAVGYRNHQMDTDYGKESFNLTRNGPVFHLTARF